MFGTLLVVSVILCILVTPNISQESVFTIYETVDSINAQGYYAETHHVITDDGYILEMHRIPHKRGTFESPTDRPVVFLMHGLLAASNSFIYLGANYSIGYNLADAGFDVWLGNARGNKNSRHHVTLNPDDPIEKFEFFDFTFEQIGMYDVGVMVDYVLEHTGKKDLHYIGHSQGGTAFLVLNSMRPEYNKKFASAHLLAGVGYMEHFPNGDLAQAARYTDMIYNMALMSGFVELFPLNSTESDSADIADMCAGDSSLDFLCDLMGVNDNLGDDNEEDNIAAGASMKQIAHFGQNIRDAKFRRWQFGYIQNLIVYGSFTAPDYNLSLINVNVTMHYTLNDNLLDERDVWAMVNDMPHATARKVARETFLHEDFVFAEDVKELVTDYIIDAINSFQYPIDNIDVENIDDLDNNLEEIDVDAESTEEIKEEETNENLDENLNENVEEQIYENISESPNLATRSDSKNLSLCLIFASTYLLLK